MGSEGMVMTEMTARRRRLKPVVSGIVARLRVLGGEHVLPGMRGVAWQPTGLPDMLLPVRRGDASVIPLTISQRFPAAREQVKVARDYVGDALGDGHERRYDAMLVVSELAGNAVEYGSCRDGALGEEFELSVTFVGRGVLLAVQDGGSPRIPRVKSLEGEEVGGRGLALVDLLARRWGFHRDSVGTLVWAELDDRCPVDC